METMYSAFVYLSYTKLSLRNVTALNASIAFMHVIAAINMISLPSLLFILSVLIAKYKNFHKKWFSCAPNCRTRKVSSSLIRLLPMNRVTADEPAYGR